MLSWRKSGESDHHTIRVLRKRVRVLEDDVDGLQTERAEILRGKVVLESQLSDVTRDLKHEIRMLEEKIELREMAIEQQKLIIDAGNEQRRAEAAIASMKLSAAKSPGRRFDASNLVHE